MPPSLKEPITDPPPEAIGKRKRPVPRRAFFFDDREDGRSSRLSSRCPEGQRQRAAVRYGVDQISNDRDECGRSGARSPAQRVDLSQCARILRNYLFKDGCSFASARLATRFNCSIRR
jgi:hypothetical protein